MQRYQQQRLHADAIPATVKRESPRLHHMLVLAVDNGKRHRGPEFTKLEGEKISEGFVGWSEFGLILAELNGQWRKNLVEFQFLSGWRSGKVKNLERQVL